MSTLAAPRYDLHEVLDRLEALQVFPDVAVRIHEVVKDSQSTLEDMEKAMSMDPALAARLLKVANSSFYGLNRSVPTVRRAVQLLGFFATRDLAMALAVGSMGRRSTLTGRAVWEHSVIAGIAARRVVDFRTRLDASQAFIGGLLHDIGVIMMLTLVGEPYEVLVKSTRLDGDRLTRAERSRFGFDHAALGGACLRRWELPEPICDGVEHHHVEQQPGPRLLGNQLRPLLRMAAHIAHAMNRVRSAPELAMHVLEHESNQFMGLQEREALSLARMLGQDRSEVRLYL